MVRGEMPRRAIVVGLMKHRWVALFDTRISDDRQLRQPPLTERRKTDDMSNDAHLFEGEFLGKAVKPEIGSLKGKRKVRVSMRITTPGDRHGQILAYEGKLDPDNIKYTKRAMVALGWQGRDVKTFIADVMKADKEVPITVRIASFIKDDGTVRKWSSIDRIGAFAPPLEKLDDDGVRDMNSWFAEVQDDSGAPRDADFGGYGKTTSPSSDDLPF